MVIQKQLGRHEDINKREPVRSHPLIAWVIQPAMFLLIGVNNVLPGAVMFILKTYFLHYFLP